MIASVSSLTEVSAPSNRPPLALVPGMGRQHPGPSPAHPSMMAAAARQRAEHCFLEWLADPSRPDDVQLIGEGDRVPLRTLLDLMGTSPQTLTDRATATLGMPMGTTIGAAATQLARTVNDSNESRLRS